MKKIIPYILGLMLLGCTPAVPTTPTQLVNPEARITPTATSDIRVILDHRSYSVFDQALVQVGTPVHNQIFIGGDLQHYHIRFTGAGSPSEQPDRNDWMMVISVNGHTYEFSSAHSDVAGHISFDFSVPAEILEPGLNDIQVGVAGAPDGNLFQIWLTLQFFPAIPTHPPPPVTLAPTATIPPAPEPITIVKVLDGGTIQADWRGEVVVIHYLGIDAPAVDEVCGEQAARANAALLEGQIIEFVALDDYFEADGRHLVGYVYAGDVFINATLVERGYAVAQRSSQLEYATLFATLESGARGAGLGCWVNAPFRDAFLAQYLIQQLSLSEKTSLAITRVWLDDARQIIAFFTSSRHYDETVKWGIMQVSEAGLNISLYENDPCYCTSITVSAQKLVLDKPDFVITSYVPVTGTCVGGHYVRILSVAQDNSFTTVWQGTLEESGPHSTVASIDYRDVDNDGNLEIVQTVQAYVNVTCGGLGEDGALVEEYVKVYKWDPASSRFIRMTDE